MAGTSTKHQDRLDRIQACAAEYPTIALVLQGGGALGAYQCGVYEGLTEAGVLPNWLAGISIGAINAAIIAGNPPEERLAQLKSFWDQISHPGDALSMPATYMRSMLSAFPQTDLTHSWAAALSAGAAMLNGQSGFFESRPVSPFFNLGGGDAATSFYDTAPLKQTLERCVDFDRINHKDSCRLTVGAAEVTTGNFRYFDSRETKIRPEHIMASGALPPAFPAVEIDGVAYWDGGLISNTPLEYVLDLWPREDTLALQVDLWSARGPMPNSMLEVLERQKDIQYSSRTRHGTDMVARTQRLRTALGELIKRLPDKKVPDELEAALAPWLDDRVFNIVHFIYQAKSHEENFKDYAFGKFAMREHWESGLRDTRMTMAHPEFLKLPDRAKGYAVHDVHRNAEKSQVKPE
ncbi:patatin-like phospholipase family protein [Lysobacter sp. HDW10]|uniref:patatin-like phospholipase family protein n=1 Tax=Lysobacter sp. HDW10 TaxID=2714936 RepID=UPI00140733BE|nr:DUF3734 domain-containing protein [Lysobacter sp. HDW10]QIK81388.1 patatin-like phospholipase family protein [Lysobacter sp. HDW10]